jgi:hypothetical protein
MKTAMDICFPWCCTRNMRRKPCFLIGAVLSLLTCLNSAAQGTALPLVPSVIGPLQIGPYQDHQEFTFPTPAVSLANYGGVNVAFAAPAGYAWRFDPSVWPSLHVYCNYGTATTGDVGYYGALPRIVFLPGWSSTFDNSPRDPIRTSETGVGFDYHISFGGVVEFTSIMIPVPHFATYDEYPRQLPLAPFDRAYIDGSGNLNGGLTLVPVPEPHVLAFLGGAGVMLALGRLSRRAKA